MRSITLNLVRKWKLYELQSAQEDVPMDDDSDFGLLVNPDLYVKFDDKIKLAEMLKSCTRDQLTKVIQLIRQESNSEQHMIDKVSSDRF